MSMPYLHRLPKARSSIDLLSVERKRNLEVGSSVNVLFKGIAPSRDVLTLGERQIRIDGADMLSSTLQMQAHLAKLKGAQAHAQKARQFFPNFSRRHYGALVVLDNGVEATGTNVEASRHVTACDLRYAMTHAVNQTIAAASPQASERGLSQPKVKTVYLVNANLVGEPPVPCSDCQEWLGSPLCSPDTTVVSLEKDPQKDQGSLVRIRKVQDLLPLHQGRKPVRMVTNRPLASLPVEMSATAKARLSHSQSQIDIKKLRQTLIKAQADYSHNAKLSTDSGLKTGACVLLSPFGKLTAASRFDWTTRWHESADLQAAANAFTKTEAWQKPLRNLSESKWYPGWAKRLIQPWLEAPKIQAVAYYGDDPKLPPIASLGRMARRRGCCETLVVTAENDTIQVRTIADFMPEMYQTKPVPQLVGRR